MIAIASVAQGQSFDDLKTGFKQDYEQKLLMPYHAEKKVLIERYVTAAKRALDDATKAGNLDASLVIKKEIELLESGGMIPPTDGDGVPPAIRKLRAVFRSESAKICRAYLQKAAPFLKGWDEKAQSLETALTKQNDLTAANSVRAWRGEAKMIGNIFDPQPRTIKHAVIPANQADGFKLGAVSSGSMIRIKYLQGSWKAWGQNATENPDSQEGGAETPERQEQCRLVLAVSAADGGQAVTKVPPNTSKAPFNFLCDKSYQTLVARINDTAGSFDENPGEVVYEITITPPVLP